MIAEFRMPKFGKWIRVPAPLWIMASFAMISLSSSCLSGVDYDPETRLMFLRFRSGRTYTLRGVPVEKYVGLLNASSKGRYFNYHLKGRY